MQQQLATARASCNRAQAGAAGDDGRPRHGGLLARHAPQLSARQLDAGHERLAGAGRRDTPRSSADVRSAISANAVLSPQQLATLSPADQQQIQAARQWSAVQQALAHEALANASSRFAAIQSLIAAISTRRGSEGDPRSAGADQCRARHAAERADQAAGPLSGDPGAGIGANAQQARELVNRRTGQLRHPLPAGP